MGAVRELLASTTLPDRERHNSRIFCDLCENIHIHYREYRLVFSLDEFFEFVDVVEKSQRDARNYLSQNSSYREFDYPTTVMVAGGPERQRKFIENSPRPDQSAYDNNVCRVELNEETVIDEIHIHYRDFRIAMNRACFREFATVIQQAVTRLDEFESNNSYVRESHPDRAIECDWSQPRRISESDTPTLGVQEMDIEQIKSVYLGERPEGVPEWRPRRETIQILKDVIERGERVAPILLTKRDSDGKCFIIDGHHRYRAFVELGRKKVSAVVTPFDWEGSEPLRLVERTLKAMDEDTLYEYGLSDFWKDYIAYKANRHYRNHFETLRSRRGRFRTWLRAKFRRVRTFTSNLLTRSNVGEARQ